MNLPDPITPEAIEAARDELGLSKAACAVLAEVTPSAYSRWLSGDRDIGVNKVNKLVKHLRVMLERQ